MSDCDLMIRGGRVVTPSRVIAADVAVSESGVTAVGPNLPLTAVEEVDATGLHVFHGGIDPHVHFNEPGRTDWETIATGSAVLAAGGYTTFIDMPLNSRPVTVDGEAFDLKLEAATAFSLVDFGLWGGLVPGNLDRLEELAQRGVVGFKAFMCSSGLDDFPPSDDRTLHEGMQRIVSLGSILLLHAENAWIRSLVRRLTRVGLARATSSARGRRSPNWRPSLAPSFWPARPGAASTSCT